MSWSLAGRPLRSVLVSRLRYLGDIAMSTILLEVLQRGDPGLEIGFLCEAAYAPLLRGHPALRRIHSLATRRRGTDAEARRTAAGLEARAGSGMLSTAAALRRSGYDLSVDLFFNPRSAWLLWLGGSPQRIGGARSWRRRLYTHTVQPPAAGERAAFRRLAPGGLGDHLSRLAPLRQAGGDVPFLDWFERTYGGEERPRPRLPVPSLGRAAARDALAALEVPASADFLLLAPGATWPTKEWPALHWAALVRALREQTFLPLVVLCPPGGAGPYAELSSLLPPGTGGLLPVLPLEQVARLVGAARLVISVDGGIVHTAVAMGRPTLALYGPTDPAIWFPYEDLGPYRVLCTHPACHPCDRHTCPEFVCLPELAADLVAETAGEMLAETGRTG